MKKKNANSGNDILVFISGREATCDECGQALGSHAWITLKEGKASCLSCSDLEHLVFLPSGDVALTRRSKKYSRLSAVVLKWSKARKRYERQGLLVENEAVERAEQECAADAGQRESRRAQAVVRRAEIDEEYVRKFAAHVRTLYPGCPSGREAVIAEHACRKYSGRVGRTAMAKDLNAKAIALAVRAHIRHTETDYDDLLSQGHDRLAARDRVKHVLDTVEREWRSRS
jgi:hypothetical protein